MKLRLLLSLVAILVGTLTACQTQVVIVPDEDGGESGEVLNIPTPTTVPTPTPKPPRVLTICSQEPGSLFLYRDSSSAARAIRQAIYDGPTDLIGYQVQPVILTKMPSLQDGGAWLQPVEVAPGDLIANAEGDWVAMGPGVSYRPSGCADSSCAQVYEGTATVQMDALVAHYQLLPDLRWSDGEALTAADSVYSFQVYQELFSNISPQLLQFTDSYLAVDDLTIEWRGIPGYVGSLETKFFAPLPAHQLAGMEWDALLASDLANRTPMGWGPYVIAEWVSGDHLTLDRNLAYFRVAQGYPRFDHLVFRFFTDGDLAIDALVVGECDYIDRTLLNETHLPRLQAEAQAGTLQFNIQTGTAWELAVFGIDTLNQARYDLFELKEVRQAVAMCIDRQKIVTQVLDGLTTVPDTYVPPNHPLAASETSNAYDPETARELLASVGWIDHDQNPDTPVVSSGVAGIPDGVPFQFEYLGPSDFERPQVGAMIQSDLAQCGLDVELVSLDWEALMAPGPEGPLFGRRFAMAQLSWSYTLEPTCELFTSDEIPGPIPDFPKGWGGGNLTGYHNPVFDQACQGARLALPGSEAMVLAHREAQNLFLENLPAIPLYQRIRLVAMRTDLCNLDLDPAGYETLSALEWLDYGDGCP